MPWYATGTVSVTNGSTTVTGSGTNFVSGAQVGEGFYGPDDRLYEIQAIVSATSLTLADNYLGSTQTGQAYKIVPTQSLVANLASQVSTLISDFQNVVDEAGEGKFDDGSATSPGITFTQDQDTGFFRDTANEIGIAAGGSKIGEFNANGLTVDALDVAEINDMTVGRGAGDIGTNTVLGVQAMDSNTTGNSNTAIGREALEANTTGNGNVAVGFLAMEANTEGNNNTALGREALQSNTTGNSNTALGLQALQLNDSGGNNTAVGLQVLKFNTTGINNAAIGFQALNSNTSGANNTALGRLALNSNTIGDDNTAVGRQAGDVITTGNKNTLLGSFCDPSAEDGDDQIVVGYNLTGKGDDTAFVGGTNGAYNEKNVTTWETTSDQRIKKNIADNNDGLNVISQVRVRNFEYRAPDEITELPSHAAVEQDGTQIGVIAQELQQVLPECVSKNSTGVLSVNTDPLVWYLINAVKELKTEIEELKGN